MFNFPLLWFPLIWLIHGLAWFVASAFFAVVRGGWNAMRPRSAAAIGLASALLHKLVVVYFGLIQ